MGSVSIHIYINSSSLGVLDSKKPTDEPALKNATPAAKMENFDAKGSLRTGGPLGMGISIFRDIPYADGSLGSSFGWTDRSLVYVVHLITILKTTHRNQTSLSNSLGKKWPALRDPCGALVGFAVIRRRCRGNLSKSYQ